MINELQEKKANKKAEAQSYIDLATKENRSLTADEQNKFNTLITEAKAIDSQIRNIEAVTGIDTSAGRKAIVKVDTKVDNKPIQLTEEYRSALGNYLRGGVAALNGDEKRVLSKATDGAGGYAVAQEYDTVIREKLAEINFMRAICNVITTQSDRNICVETTVGSAYLVGENDEIGSTDDPAFDRVTLGAYKLAKLIKVSEELTQDAMFDVPAYLGRNFAKAFGLKEQALFLTGAGATGNPATPKGVITSATTGVTAASATALTGDEIIKLVYSMPQPYRAGSVFVMNDATVAEVRLLKDKNDRYVWVDGFGSTPNTLCGYPVYTSTAVATIAAGAKAICFFNPAYYTIADRGSRSVKVLDQTFAVNGQVGYVCSERVDAALTDSDAARNLVMGAASSSSSS